MAVTTTTQAATSAPAPSTFEQLLYLQAPGLVRAHVADRLERLGLPVAVAADPVEALRLLSDEAFGCCLVDLGHSRSALTTIRLVRARHPALPLIGLFDPGYPGLAAEAMQMGVVDVLAWPFRPTEFGTILSQIRDRAVAPLVPDDDAAAIGVAPQSGTMRAVIETLRAAIAARHGVALIGERGCGRRTMARRAHILAGRTPERFVSIDCARPTPAGLERLLFGHVHERIDAGVTPVTERVTDDAALWRARSGTLVLAHLPEAPARVQARLARVLRDREVLDEAGRPTELDGCLVATLESSLEAAVQDGRLRRDLADRLGVVLEVPALRHRREDIPMLAVQVLRDACRRQGTTARAFSRSALALIAALPWPGNVADLVALVDSLIHTASGPIVQLEDVLAHARMDGIATRIDTGGTLREARQRFEREWISAMLIRHHGRVGEAAKALGIQRTNLYRKVRQLKVDKALLSPRTA